MEDRKNRKNRKISCPVLPCPILLCEFSLSLSFPFLPSFLSFSFSSPSSFFLSFFLVPVLALLPCSSVHIFDSIQSNSIPSDSTIEGLQSPSPTHTKTMTCQVWHPQVPRVIMIFRCSSMKTYFEAGSMRKKLFVCAR